MQRKGLIFGAGALAVAVGAIGAGALVSSNAMAASGDVGDHALTISMMSVNGEGDAFQCRFDASAVPVQPIAVSGAGTASAGIVTSAVGEGLPEGATVIAGGKVIGAGPGDSLPALLAPGHPGSGDGVIITGSANADGTSTVSRIAPDGSVTPVNVREGTAAECAAAQKGLPPASVTSGSGTPAPDAPTQDSGADPKG